MDHQRYTRAVAGALITVPQCLTSYGMRFYPTGSQPSLQSAHASARSRPCQDGR
jgi:hypothetical protein